MLIVSPETLKNPAVLETRSLPKKIFGRVMIYPKGASAGLWLRLIVEVQILRYLTALLPFALMPFYFHELALPITQAPIAMVLLIGVVEMRGLRLSPRERKRVVDADEADRRLDLLAFRARACLRRIAARQGLTEGQLRLVVEQSELARIPPLTLVSVQSDHPAPRVLSLDAGDRAVLMEGLFDADLSERDLAAVNQRQEAFIRDIVQEARGVSAHGRLAAALERRTAAAAANAAPDGPAAAEG
jgi:hypothetical protein